MENLEMVQYVNRKVDQLIQAGADRAKTAKVVCEIMAECFQSLGISMLNHADKFPKLPTRTLIAGVTGGSVKQVESL